MLLICSIHFCVIDAGSQCRSVVIYKNIDHITLDGAAGILGGVDMAVNDDLYRGSSG